MGASKSHTNLKEYRPTDLGPTLSEAFCGVWVWAEANLERIEASREASDSRAADGAT